MIIFLVIALLIALVAVVFALQNTALVTVSFLTGQTQGSLALILLITLAAGVLIGYLLTLPPSLKDKWTLRGLRKRLTDAEARLAVTKSRVEELEAQLNPVEPPQPVPSLPPAATPAPAPAPSPTAAPASTSDSSTPPDQP